MIYSKKSAEVKFPDSTFKGFSMLENPVYIQPRCSIGERVYISARALIHSEVVIGDDVTVGTCASIHPGSVIAPKTFIPPHARIPGNRTGINRALVINGVSGRDSLTAIVCDDGLIVNSTAIDARDGLNTDDVIHQAVVNSRAKMSDYALAVAYIETWYEIRTM